MRKKTVAALGAMLLLVMAISPAAAHGKPDRVVGNEPAVFEIEGSCEFPVLVEDSFARFQILTFGEDADGNVRSDIQATFRGTLTNEDTGASMPYVLAGRAALRFWADGRTSTAGSGTGLAWYDAASAAASQLGQGIFLVSGRVTEQYDADGNLVDATARGRIVDVCAALS
jgi:hypothetical protein